MRPISYVRRVAATLLFLPVAENAYAKAHALPGRAVKRRGCLICSWSFCLAWLTLCGVANAATLTIAWNRNPEPDIAGYVVHWGTQSGVYTSSSNVGNVTTQQVTGLADGTVYYFVVKAYNTAGVMSGYSSEVSGQSGYSSGVSGQSGYSSEVSGQTSGGGPPVDYTNTPADPAGVIGADFNGDSRPDLIWQNASTWQAVVWYMGGSQGASAPGLDLAVASGRSRLAHRRRTGLQRRRQARSGLAERRHVGSRGVVHGRPARKQSPRLEQAGVCVYGCRRLERRRGR